MITSTTSRASFAGTGTTGPFGFTFKIFDPSTDLRVIRRDVLGVEHLLVYATDFTVVGIKSGVDAYGGGGTVNLTAALNVGETLLIRRAPPAQQKSSLQNQGPYFPKGLEDQLDYLTMLVQAHEDALSRAFKFSETTDPTAVTPALPAAAPAPGSVLTLSDNGLAIQTKVLDATGSIAIPGFGRTVATTTDYIGNNQLFDPRDWLASANGIADDGAKVQSAHDAAAANGGECVLSRGTYRASGNRTFGNGLTIRRGAKLKPAAGASLSLGLHTGGPHQQFDLSEAGSESGAIKFLDLGLLVVIVDWFGGGAGASAAANITAFRAAVASLPASGGTIQFLHGTYDFGVPTGLALLSGDVGDPMFSVVRINRDNVRIQGMGMNRTTLQWSTHGGTLFGYPGSFNLISYNIASHGLPIVSGGIDRLYVGDLTFRDSNTNGTDASSWGTDAGSAIYGIVIKNFELRNVKFLNGKGNGPFTLLGDSPNSTTPGTGDLLMDNVWCYAENRAGGLLSTGDWINVSEFGRITIRDLHIPSGGCLRHAIEFGEGIGELYVEDSMIDMNNFGFDCLASFTILGRGHFFNVEFANWAVGNCAIAVNPDQPTDQVNNLRISKCRFVGPYSGSGGVFLQNGVLKNIEIFDNYFDCFAHIVIGKWPIGISSVGPNVHCFSNGGNTAILDSGNPAPPDANSIMFFGGGDSVLQGGSGLKHVNPTSWTNLKNAVYGTQVRGLGPVRSQTPSTAQIDGVNDYSIDLTSTGVVADGALSAAFTLPGGIIGAMPGDHVIVRRRSTNRPPDGVILIGDVTAVDTVKVWFFNKSGANYGNSGTMDLRVTVRRD